MTCHLGASNPIALRIASNWCEIAAIALTYYFTLNSVAALEHSSLQNLHSTWLIRATVIDGSLAIFTGAISVVLPRESILYVVFFTLRGVCVFVLTVIAVLILRQLILARRAVLRAAKTAKGRQKQEVESARKFVTRQLLGLTAIWATTILKIIVLLLARSWINGSNGSFEYAIISTFQHSLDTLGNLLGAFVLSGVLSGAMTGSEARRQEEAARLQRRAKFCSEWQPCEDSAWQGTVEELAHRGFTIEALLRFYRDDLPSQMPDFDSARHRTTDVVRRAIIPLSRKARTAYATVMMNGTPTLPAKMVTHSWGNLFRDLIAAIVADALDEDEYEQIANLLDHDFDKVLQWVTQYGVSLQTYWVCAFSVSQHAGICSSIPRGEKDPVTNEEHIACDCGAPKYYNTTEPLYKGRSVKCEMNKFDEMMAYLSARDPHFSQVIAVDANIALFTRAWCVAEIAKAHTIGMEQHLKLLNYRALEEHEFALRHLQIERMRATRTEDIEEILANIPDKAAFNKKLTSMLFRKLIPQWENFDARDRMTMLGKVVRWHTSEAK